MEIHETLIQCGELGFLKMVYHVNLQGTTSLSYGLNGFSDHGSMKFPVYTWIYKHTHMALHLLYMK